MTPTSTATRNIAYQLHPFTNLRKDRVIMEKLLGR